MVFIPKVKSRKSKKSGRGPGPAARGKYGFEDVPCNLCGKNDYSIVFEATEIPEKRHISFSETYSAASFEVCQDQVVKCNNCGLVYINPRVKSNQIVEGYSEAVDENYVSQAETRALTFRHGLGTIERLAGGKGKILDVGCAGGLFVKEARDAGWDAYGVEPCKWLVDWGVKNHRLNLKATTLEKAKYPSNYFDVVTLWDVLEHVPDPKATLEECNRILKPNGLVVVNYPNWGSRLAQFFGRKWWFLLSIHLYYFTPKTIKKMLEVTGYEQVFTKRHFQQLYLDYFLFRAKQYFPWLAGPMLSIAQAAKFDKKPVKYYASQQLVVGKKE